MTLLPTLITYTQFFHHKCRKDDEQNTTKNVIPLEVLRNSKFFPHT